MARSSRDNAAATAARILTTARELLAERGADAVTLEQVAIDAAVTRGAVYHHYGSRRGLVAAVLAEVQRDVAAIVETAAAEAGGGWPGLEAGCLAFLEAAASPQLRRIMLVDGPAIAGWDVWRKLDAENAQRGLESGLAELAAAGRLRTPPAPTAALLSGAMNDAALWIGTQPDPRAAITEAWRPLQLMLTALHRNE